MIKEAENTCCCCIVMKITRKFYEPNITVGNRIFLQNVNRTLKGIKDHSLANLPKNLLHGQINAIRGEEVNEEKNLGKYHFMKNANSYTDLTRRLFLHNWLP